MDSVDRYFSLLNDVKSCKDKFDGVDAHNNFIDSLIALDNFIREERVNYFGVVLRNNDGETRRLPELYLEEAIRSLNERIEVFSKKPIQKLPFVLVSTDIQEYSKHRDGDLMQERCEVPRYEMLVKALAGRIGLRTSDVSVFEETVKSEMMRTAPYRLIYVHPFSKYVLVANEKREATFVGSGIFEPRKKLEIVRQGGKKIVHRDDEVWIEGVISALTHDVDLEMSRHANVCESTRDHNYYSRQQVLCDLEAFAVSMDYETPLDLALVSRKKRTMIVCGSGKPISFDTYLRHACIAFGIESNTTEAKRHMKPVLDLLQEIAGLQLLNVAYFSNPSWVREDLISFGIACGRNSIQQIEGARTIARKHIVCCNGQKCSGFQYMRLAAKAMGIDRNCPWEARTFEHLAHIAGCLPFDESYLQNTSFVRSDLIQLLQEGENDLSKLKFNRVSDKRVRCANGEDISFAQYLGRIAEIKGMNARSRAKVLGHVLEEILDVGIKKFPIMDNDYFSSEDNIEKDLLAFMQDQHCTDIRRINRVVMNASRVRCQNGEDTTGATYLYRACNALEGPTERKDIRYGEIFEKLVALCPQDSELMFGDNAYFANADNVQNDLSAFMKAQECSKITEMHRAKMMASSIQCKSGEVLVGMTYLYRAAQVYFGKTKRKDLKAGKTLDRLIEVANFNQ